MRLSDRTDTKVPPETSRQGFEVHESLRIEEVLAPLTDVVPKSFLFADVEVFRLKVHCVSKDRCFWMRPYRADPPPRTAARGAAEEDTDDNSDDLGRSSGSDCARHKLSQLQMGLIAARSRSRQTLVRPGTRSQLGRMIISCLPTTDSIRT